jgi:hypothetical protein
LCARVYCAGAMTRSPPPVGKKKRTRLAEEEDERAAEEEEVVTTPPPAKARRAQKQQQQEAEKEMEDEPEEEPKLEPQLPVEPKLEPQAMVEGAGPSVKAEHAGCLPPCPPMCFGVYANRTWARCTRETPLRTLHSEVRRLGPRGGQRTPLLLLQQVELEARVRGPPLPLLYY